MAVGAAVLDRVLEDRQKRADVLALVRLVDQDRALLQQVAVALQHQVDRGVEQRMAGADEGGDRAARRSWPSRKLMRS